MAYGIETGSQHTLKYFTKVFQLMQLLQNSYGREIGTQENVT